MTIWRFADLIDAPEPEARLSLGEGNTPLLRSRSIGPRAGMPNLYFKVEATNLTGSYKDRFAAAAVSHMRSAGVKHCLATSSGNTGAALAAYCAAAGIRCTIAAVETAPQQKLQQMMAYGARVLRVRGFGPDPQITRQTFETIQALGREPGNALQISAYRYSPQGMKGVETIAFELAEQIDGPIDHVFCPAGGGGLTLAVARGFAKLHARNPKATTTAIHCVQPRGNDTIASPLQRGDNTAQAVTCTTRISGLQVPDIVDGDDVIAACRAVGGQGHLVDDEEVWRTQQRLAREEGIFCEPAGAVALTAALNAAHTGRIPPHATTICLITGTGFKDSASITQMLAGEEAPMIALDDLPPGLQ